MLLFFTVLIYSLYPSYRFSLKGFTLFYMAHDTYVLLIYVLVAKKKKTNKHLAIAYPREFL